MVILGITVSINGNSYDSKCVLSSFSTDTITVSAFLQFLGPPLVCALCSGTVRPPLATALVEGVSLARESSANGITCYQM